MIDKGRNCNKAKESARGERERKGKRALATNLSPKEEAANMQQAATTKTARSLAR